MTSWIPYVFVRIVIFFIGGIVLGIFYPDSISLSIATWIAIVLGLVYLLVFVLQRQFQFKSALPGFIALLAIFISGYICLLVNDQLRNPDHLSSFDNIQSYSVVIATHPQERERSWKFEADVEYVMTSDWRKASGKIMIYLSKDSAACAYDYGDVLVVKGSPQPVPPPGNPDEFDYRKFLSYRNIFHQHFIRGHELIKVESDPPYMFIQLAIRARVWADATLQRFVQGEREQATISALVLGVTDGLDNELLNAYAGTGAMHVLAVSGLHISIVYLLISFLLSPLKKLKHGKALLAIVSIFILWAYSFITGLSPSVLRAVVMFTFMALARASDRQTNIYNTLAVAAFCLLVYDPYMIMSVGFQLSFFAVIGILYFHPFIYSWWQPRNWLLNEIWTITSVSIAAQVSTFPLGLLYFHQFPNYFLFANLFVIPGSFVVLLGGILLLAISFVPMIADFIGLILSWIIKLLNNIVFFFESLPYSLIENIYISVYQSYLMAGIIVFITLLCVKRNLVYLKAAIIISVLFAGGQWWWMLHVHRDTSLAIYKVPGHFAMDVIHEGNASFAADSVFQTDIQKQKFHIRPNRIIHAVNNVSSLEAQFQSVGFDVIMWRGKQILHIKKKGIDLPSSLKPNLVIISNNAFDQTGWPAYFQNVTIVLDSSNSFYFAEKVIHDKANERLNIYSVQHRGAFEMSLNTDGHELRNL
jgi:competence protein ComEC